MIREGQGMGQHIHSQCDSSRVGTESLERVGRQERDQRENAFVLLGEGPTAGVVLSSPKQNEHSIVETEGWHSRPPLAQEIHFLHSDSPEPGRHPLSTP